MMTIDIEIVSKALGAAWSRIQECRVQINAYAEADEHYDDFNRDEYLEDIVTGLVAKTHQASAAVRIVFELLGLSKSIVAIDADLAEIEDNIGKVSYFDEYIGPHNQVVDLLASRLELAAPLVRTPAPIVEQRRILVTMLQQLPYYFENSGELPTREQDLQDALLPLLRLAFPDVLPHPAAPKQTKTYFPDFGSESLKAAIEVKFVDEKAKAALAIGGLYEDMKGYADSGFSLFIGFIYMTGNFVTREQVDAELKKVGTPKSWMVFPVFGHGGKKAGKSVEHKAKPKSGEAA